MALWTVCTWWYLAFSYKTRTKILFTYFWRKILYIYVEWIRMGLKYFCRKTGKQNIVGEKECRYIFRRRITKNWWRRNTVNICIWKIEKNLFPVHNKNGYIHLKPTQKYLKKNSPYIHVRCEWLRDWRMWE